MDALTGNAIVCGGAWVLSAATDCYRCGASTPVFTILLAGPFVLHGEPDLAVQPDDGGVLTVTMSGPLPAMVHASADSQSEGRFRLDRSHTAGLAYWMNHCADCDTKLGDFYLERPGEAFFPLDAEGFAGLSGSYIAGPLTFIEPCCGHNGALAQWVRERKQESLGE